MTIFKESNAQKYIVNDSQTGKLKFRVNASNQGAYARRRGGDRFELRLNTASYLKTLKMVPDGDTYKHLTYKLLDCHWKDVRTDDNIKFIELPHH